MRTPFAAALLAALLPLSAQESPEPKAPKAEAATKDEGKALPKPVSTHHQITAGGKVLKYTATAGYMPLVDDKGAREAKLFYTAYTLDGAPRRTPRR